ncbi:hypothetical protein K491DRAFT_299034 [Lophiostoma macrostomum CBS 122681]|uniref:BTB domain-containing protein n=1 Tax=Lophiostoma macrostomum CBS 122681 TaxID=1314788 RepID=A0A6A6SJ07_9PLEO|nr:hypothetical protein K491DRAFT_299034 [Lophiostoma macrostomum CBS 122681]
MNKTAVLDNADLKEKLLKSGIVEKMKWFPQTSGAVELHAKALMDTPIGRDFTIISSDGVKFKVHTAMIIGGPLALQDFVYPGNMDNPKPRKMLQMTQEFRYHSFFMERLVSFMYRGSYHAMPMPEEDKQQSNGSNTRVTSPTPNLTNMQLHLYMYHLAEGFRYPALASHVFSRLVQSTLSPPSLTPTGLHALIRSTFSQPPTGYRICEDSDRALQTLVLSVATIHVLRKWRGIGGSVKAEIGQAVGRSPERCGGRVSRLHAAAAAADDDAVPGS